MADTVKPPFDPWTTPGGLGGTLDPAVLAAIRADLIANPLNIPLSQMQGYQRTTSGYIGPTGTIISSNPPGTFTVSNPSTGNYTITFLRAYKTIPAVVANANSSGNGRTVIPANFATTGFTIEIYDPAGVAQNEPFSFFAQGR